MRFSLSILCLAGAFFLSACVSLGLVGQYDPEIEKGVNSYHKAAVSFVATAVEKRQLYNQPSVQKFYSEQGALIRNLLINSQVNSQNKPCKIGFLANNRALTSENVQSDLVGSNVTRTDNKSSCTSIVLNHLHNSHTALQEIHRSNQRLTPVAANIALAQIEDAVRIALRNEQGKKVR